MPSLRHHRWEGGGGTAVRGQLSHVYSIIKGVKLLRTKSQFDFVIVIIGTEIKSHKHNVAQAL